VKQGENKTVYKGTFEVPNLSEEYQPKEVDVTFTLKDNNKNEKLKDFARKEGLKRVREQLEKYLILLKEEFSQGLILPTSKEAAAAAALNSDKAKSSPAKTPSTASTNPTTATTTSSSSSNGSLGAKIETKTLTMNEEFKCRVNEIYNVFTNINLVKAFTQNTNLVYEPERGGKFSLFDGNISGTFIKLIPNKRITMNWRNKRWPEGYYSLAIMEFEEKEDHSLLTLTQTGIPQSFLENTEDGWRNFYWNAIRQKFGFASRIF